jgi:hypothetical protein
LFENQAVIFRAIVVALHQSTRPNSVILRCFQTILHAFQVMASFKIVGGVFYLMDRRVQTQAVRLLLIRCP